METYDDDNEMECQNCGDPIGEDEPRIEVARSRDLPWPLSARCEPGAFCHECLTECPNCEQMTDPDEMLYDSTAREQVCGECYSARWTACDYCGDECSTDDSRYDDDSGYTYCPECYSEQAGGCSLPVEQCHLCGTNNVHFHLLSERYVCDCEAEKEPAAYIVRVNTLQNA